MGYYSNVKFITTQKGWEMVQKHVRQAAPDNGDFIVADSHTVPLCGGKYILLEHDGIKWYEGQFDDVDAFMLAIKKLDILEIPYRYARTGEDYEDIERLDTVPWNEGYNDMPYLNINIEIEVEY